MQEKEEEILMIIKDFYKENKLMPSFRYIQKKAGYKSINSIEQYIKSLENKGYLIRNYFNKLIINDNTTYDVNIKRIKILNVKNGFIYLNLNKRKNYLGYRLKNNFFQNQGILKNDILIIERKTYLKNDEIGLFIIDNKPRIMIYNYQDGFFILKDNETLILNKVKIIGKIVQIVRKIEKL